MDPNAPLKVVSDTGITVLHDPPETIAESVPRD